MPTPSHRYDSSNAVRPRIKRLWLRASGSQLSAAQLPIPDQRRNRLPDYTSLMHVTCYIRICCCYCCCDCCCAKAESSATDEQDTDRKLSSHQKPLSLVLLSLAAKISCYLFQRTFRFRFVKMNAIIKMRYLLKLNTSHATAYRAVVFCFPVTFANLIKVVLNFCDASRILYCEF